METMIHATLMSFASVGMGKLYRLLENGSIENIMKNNDGSTK